MYQQVGSSMDERRSRRSLVVATRLYESSIGYSLAFCHSQDLCSATFHYLSELFFLLVEFAWNAFNSIFAISKEDVIPRLSHAHSISSFHSNSVSDGSDLDESLSSDDAPREEDEDNACTFDLTTLDGSTRKYTRGHTLTLTDFFSSAKDVQDALSLGKQLKEQTQCNSVHFEDRLDGSNYRRWRFKKDALHGFILEALEDHKLPLTFAVTVELDTQTLSARAISSLLRELQKDKDVKNVAVQGPLEHRQAEIVVIAMVSLLSHDQREWQIVQWNVQVTAKVPHEQRDARTTDNVCRKALRKVAEQRDICVWF